MSIVESLLDSFIKYLQKKRNSIRRQSKKRRVKRVLKKSAHLKKKIPPKIIKKKILKHNSKKPLAGTAPAVKQGKNISTVKVKLKDKPSAVVKEKQKIILVGQVTHFFPRIEVAVIKILDKEIKVGESIKVQNGASSFIQKVESMQRESVDVSVARKGQLIGLKVKQKVQEGAKVFKVL
jgi:hypothetical protein